MQLTPRPGSGDLLEEDQELIVAVAGEAAAQHLAGGGLQRGEQVGDPVADVVVGAPLRKPWPQPQGRGGTLQRLDLGLSSTHTTIAPAGGSRYSPHRSSTLACSWGSVENLKVSVRQGLRSCSAHTLATVMRLTPRWRASARVDQWVMPSCWGGGCWVTATISARRSRRTVRGLPERGQSASPASPLAAYRPRQRITVGRAQPTCSAIWVLDRPWAAASTILAR